MEFYWNTDEKAFFERMVEEHHRFWESDNRLSKAKKLGLTTNQVYTLASIVEREISNSSEKRRVAGFKNKTLLQGESIFPICNRTF